MSRAGTLPFARRPDLSTPRGNVFHRRVRARESSLSSSVPRATRHLLVVALDGRILRAEARSTHGRNHMPIRPKDRFEAFKRDAFTCQYCGRKTPDVTLEADHIIPVSEGGGDELENLVTACFDCNRGKGARSLTRHPLTPDLAAQADLLREREEQLRVYHEARREQKERREAVYNDVRNHWFNVWGETELDRWHIPWTNALRSAIETLGPDEVKEAMDINAGRFNYVTSNAVRYFGGIIKHKIAEHDGRSVTCKYCGVKIALTRDEALRGVVGWYHVSCKEKAEK